MEERAGCVSNPAPADLNLTWSVTREDAEKVDLNTSVNGMFCLIRHYVRPAQTVILERD
jgi:hypothetical protein